MQLVYRALWQESRQDPEASIRKTLSKWSSPQTIEVLNANGDSGLAVTEMRSSFERDKRVTIRVTRRDEKQYVWVDVENFSASSGLESMDRIQSLIQDLIDDSEKNHGNPRRGEIRFQSRVQIAGPVAVKLIPQSNRKAAIICIAHDPLREENQKKLAKLLARQFAGSALVVYLPPGDLGRFQNEVGGDLSLYPGEIRIYPPAKKESRNVISIPPISALNIQKTKHEKISARVLQALQSSLVATPVPQVCEEGARLLRGSQNPDDEKMQERQNIDFENLLKENERLRDTVASLHSDRDHDLEAIDHLEDQLRNTKRMMQESEDWWRGLLDEENAKRVAAEEERTDVELRFIDFAMSENLKRMRKESVYSISSITEALERGRTVLRKVQIPHNVSNMLEDLEGNQRSRTWGRSIWDALLAFNVFAESQFNGNFLKWCETSGDAFVWHAQNISMRESETVHSNERLRSQRILPVATELDPSGKVFMEAHLKFGGSSAPRLYFYDDSKGATGKIHIGGLDPHSRWENTTT